MPAAPRSDADSFGTPATAARGQGRRHARVALSAEPDALDPTPAGTLVGRYVFTSICEKLYDIDAKLAVVPQLATALPQSSADGKTVTIKLRPGVKFADGTPLDAAAVKTSLDRAPDPRRARPARASSARRHGRRDRPDDRDAPPQDAVHAR